MVKNPGYYVISNGVWSVGNLVSTLICDAILICLRPKKKKTKSGNWSDSSSSFSNGISFHYNSKVEDEVMGLRPTRFVCNHLQKNYQIIKNSNSIPKKMGDKRPQKLAKIWREFCPNSNSQPLKVHNVQYYLNLTTQDSYLFSFQGQIAWLGFDLSMDCMSKKMQYQIKSGNLSPVPTT